MAPGGTWWRLYRSHHLDPLGHNFGPSRFSDPETTLAPPARFDVVYLGSSVKVCFVETILRDRDVGRIKKLPIEWTDLESWTCAELRINEPLSMVDLRDDGRLQMGIPTDVTGARNQKLARAWSRAFWEHDAKPDGVIYSSRLNGETNIAIYDRALTGLAAVATPRLVECRSELAAIIDYFDLSII